MARREIRLLGRPVVLIDGVPALPARGVKPWGLLAYLAVSSGPHSRVELAELFFGRAEDPLGALRWSLAALRRLLDLPEALKGDQVRLDLPEDSTLDTQAVERGDPEILAQPGLGQELLAGLTFSDCAGFETWLISQRRRFAALSSSLLREAALHLAARGEYEQAIRYATDLVAIDPLDEGHHALLIRVHMLAGDTTAARRQLERCREILRTELSVEPGVAVMAAANTNSAFRSAQPAEGKRDAADARLAVAWESFLGGAIDHGIDLGRGAVWLADGCGEPDAQVLARIFLGAMLSMAVRGWDEAATALTQALHLARELNHAADTALALGILAGNGLMRGDYEAAIRHARDGLSADDAGARSVNLTILAAAEADTAQHEQALAHSRESMAAAEASGDPVQIVYAAAHAGRILLMRGNITEAPGRYRQGSIHNPGNVARPGAAGDDDACRDRDRPRPHRIGDPSG